MNLNDVELLEELPYYRSMQKQHQPHRTPHPVTGSPAIVAQYQQQQQQQQQQHQQMLHHPPPHHPQSRSGGGIRPEEYEETSIAIIAPDIRLPSHHHHQGGMMSTSASCHSNTSEQYTALGAFSVALSIVTYLSDIGTDIAACYALFLEGRFWSSGLTASFVVVAAIIVNVLSIHWYVQNQKSMTPYQSLTPTSWVVRCIFHVLLLGQIYRYLCLLCAGCLSPIQQNWDNREHIGTMERRKRRNAQRDIAIREDKETATLALMHSFLESAPQLILQLYTLAQRTDSDKLLIVIIQGGSAGTSLLHLAWSITSYNNTLHRTVSGKRKSNTMGMVLQFLWHFCTIGSRACTIALFTKEYHFWLFPFCIGHWGVMTVWVMHQQTHFCQKDGAPQQCKEYMCNMVIGVAYMIYYLNVKAEPTRYKYSAYYAIVFAENCTLMVLWFIRNDPGLWYHIPALVAVFSSFVSGIIFMLFYYGFCHQTLKQTNEKRAAHCC